MNLWRLIKYNLFHPYLEKALGNHVVACINKPIDLDELFYWLRVIEKSDAKTDNPSKI